jgi:hypothetical protein
VGVFNDGVAEAKDGGDARHDEKMRAQLIMMLWF